MKAVRYSRFGPAHDVVELVEVDEPAPPAAGEVLLEIERSSINPADLLSFAGRYGATPPPLPVWAGGEAVARVQAVGPGVTHLKVGDLVLPLLAGRGNWRQRTTLKAERLFALPEADLDQLAMVGVNPPTAWLMLHDFVTLQPGDWVMQNAGNSAVGQLVIQIARQLGFRTISIVRQESQRAPLLELGADVVLVDGDDVSERALAQTGGVRPRLGIDAVAGDSTRKIASALATDGVVVNYGLLSGQPCAVSPSDVVFRNISLRGFWLALWFAKATLAEQQQLYGQLAQMLSTGALHIAVEAVYPMDQVREALRHAAQASRHGKILLAPNA